MKFTLFFVCILSCAAVHAQEGVHIYIPPVRAEVIQPAPVHFAVPIYRAEMYYVPRVAVPVQPVPQNVSAVFIKQRAGLFGLRSEWRLYRRGWVQVR